MKKPAKQLLAAALTAAMVGSFCQAQPVKAENTYVPPADRVVKTEFHNTVTVPNAINVLLKDEKGNPIKDGAFQLLDSTGKEVVKWNGFVSCLSGDPNRRFNSYSCGIRADALYNTGDYMGEIRIPFEYGYSPVDRNAFILCNYEKEEHYVSYGNKMEGLPTFTVPAGEVWIRADEGYKRAADQTLAKQFVKLSDTVMDLSDIAGSVRKFSQKAGEESNTLVSLTSIGTPSFSPSKTSTLVASATDEEYVNITLDLSTYFDEFVDKNGTHVSGKYVYHYGAPMVQDKNRITSAYLQVTSGAVTNFVALDGTSKATITLKKGDYTPRISCSFIQRDNSGYGGGGGTANSERSIYDYAKHYVEVVAPPETGTTIAYIPAGTYTLRQTKTTQGYEMAKDLTITIKDSYKVEDMQMIEVINKPIVSEHTHTFSDKWSHDAVSHWHSATCAHTDLIKDKADHTFSDWTVTQEPTETEEGKRAHTCTVCGYTAYESIDKLPPEVKPEQPEQPEQPEVKPEQPETDAPQTGEKSHVAVWGIIALAACVVLIATYPFLKKKNRKGNDK